MRRNTIWSKLLVFNPTWALILMLSESAAHQEHGSFFSQSHNPFVPSSAFVKTVKALVLFTQKTKCHPVPEPWQICLHLKVLKKKRKRRKGFSCNLRRISDCFALWDAIQAAKKASNAPGRDLVRGCLMSHIDCESKGGKKQKTKQNPSTMCHNDSLNSLICVYSSLFFPLLFHLCRAVPCRNWTTGTQTGMYVKKIKNKKTFRKNIFTIYWE